MGTDIRDTGGQSVVAVRRCTEEIVALDRVVRETRRRSIVCDPSASLFVPLAMKGLSSIMDVRYRPYVDNDLDHCTALALDAWPIASAVCEDAHPLMRAYVKCCLLFSDYTEVCCTGDEVIGLFFGLTDKKLPGLRARFELNRLFCAFVAGRYGPAEGRFRFLASFVLTFLKVELYCRRFDSEVQLFVVDTAYRGQGIGRSLVDHFVEHLREKNKRTLYLYTNMLSNWQFYEKYGFIKYGEFYDNHVSLMRGRKTQGYIYYYRL